jgi:hypothetical protein
MELARVLRMAGKSIDAEQAAREALEFYERKHDWRSAASTQAFLAKLGHP